MMWCWRPGDPGLFRPARAPSARRRPPSNAAVGLLERPEQPTVERPSAPLKPEGEEHGAGEKSRKGFLRRRPIATAFGLMFLAPSAGAGYLYWDNAAHFESTDDAFIAARQFSVAPQGVGLHHRGPGHRQPACRRRPGDRPHRRSRLSRRAGAGRGASRRCPGQHPQHRRADGRAAGADQPPTKRRSSRRRPRWCSPSSRRTLQAARQAGRGHGSERAAIDAQKLKPAAGGGRDRARRRSSWRERQIDALKAQRAQRRGEPRAGRSPARPGAAQPFLYDRHRRPARPGRQSLRRGRRICVAGDRARHVRAGRHLGHRELQGDPARPDAARAAGDASTIDAYPDRDLPRPRRQRPARIRHRVLAAAGRERHRQLRQDRPARAGQDRHRRSAAPTSRSARACRWTRPCGSIRSRPSTSG